MNSSEHHEQIYDDYLDTLLAGDSVSPARFLSRLGLADDPDLGPLLAGVYREFQATRQRQGGMTDQELPCERLGEFRLVRRLGQGGMGMVYLAEQESLERTVALKVLRPEYSGSTTADFRFEREARTVARLRHPNIVSVHAVGEEQGRRFIAMEFVPGRGLNDLLAASESSGGEAIATSAIVTWARDLARALVYAHGEGIVHRDVKPSNVRITPEGQALLLDFGLARELEEDGVTFTEAFIGSPFYAAPEQVAGQEGQIDGRTDVYGLGALLYRCLTHRRAFEAGSMERVLHQIVNEEPKTPRSLEPTISRDLETVILKAMEKSPARRYASAGALAEDLDAILDHRPIRARPVGPIVRTAKWVRRNRAVAAVLATALLVGLGTVLTLFIEKKREGRRALAEAERLIEDYRDGHRATRALEKEYEELRTERFNRFFTPEEAERVDGKEDAIAELRTRRLHTFFRVLDELRRAERHGAETTTVAEMRGRLYLVKYLEAELLGDPTELKTYRGLVLANDPHGRLRSELEGALPLHIVTEPRGAEVHVFRYREQTDVVVGGEQRLVPVPWREDRIVPTPGQWALRVSSNAGGLHENDLLLEVGGHPVRGTVLVREGRGDIRRHDRLVSIDRHPIEDDYGARTRGRKETEAGTPRTKTFRFERDGLEFTVESSSLEALGIRCGGARQIAEAGDVSALVWSGGQLRRQYLQAGLAFHATAAPLFVGEASAAGRTPTTVDLPVGEYLVLLRTEGYPDRRHFVVIPRVDEPQKLTVDLAPDRDVPRGLVRIHGDGGQGDPGFWMMRHEVTAAEYLEFLNDARTLAAIAASASPIRYPRNSRGARWDRGPDGRFVMSEEWAADSPVRAISWNDAVAYADWKTRQARSAGRRIRYGLPSRTDWDMASASRLYPYGARFRPEWVSSCFARPVPNPEPVLSFPVDESVFGVFDMSGSVSEWLDEWWLEDWGLRFCVGGSWANGEERRFSCYEGNGREPDRVSDTVGFRLVMRRSE